MEVLFSIAVAVHRYQPVLLRLSPAALYERVDEHLDGIRRYTRAGSDTYSTAGRDRLRTWKDELTWGDLAAITMAIEAMAVPQVVSHLFDFADRDMADISTEYGGLIDLDDRGRFNVLEFIPRMRQHDEKFIASQAMFDASYTALFHFHYQAHLLPHPVSESSDRRATRGLWTTSAAAPRTVSPLARQSRTRIHLPTP